MVNLLCSLWTGNNILTYFKGLTLYISFEKSQTNEYCTVSFVYFQGIWKMRMCDIHPSVSHQWKFRILVKWRHFGIQNRRWIRTVKVFIYLLQVFLYCRHISTPVRSELTAVPAAAEQRSCNEHIYWRKVGVIPAPSAGKLCHRYCATCVGEYQDSWRSFQLEVVGGKFGLRQVCVGVLYQVMYIICTFIRTVTIEILFKYLIFNLNCFIIELQRTFIFLCSQNLITPVPVEPMSHLKSYFSKISFNKYDIHSEHAHP